MCDSKQNSDSEDETDLDFDMWEGQFEFVGPSANFKNDGGPKKLVYANGLKNHFTRIADDENCVGLSQFDKKLFVISSLSKVFLI